MKVVTSDSHCRRRQVSTEQDKFGGGQTHGSFIVMNTRQARKEAMTEKKPKANSMVRFSREWWTALERSSTMKPTLPRANIKLQRESTMTV